MILGVNNVFDFKNFPFLNKGDDGSHRSEKDIIHWALFCNISILSLILLKLD